MEQNQSEKRESLRQEIRERTAGYIMAALGLVIGLAWNDAIKTAIENLFPVKQDSIFMKFFYALILTLAFVIVTNYINRFFAKKRGEIEAKKQ